MNTHNYILLMGAAAMLRFAAWAESSEVSTVSILDDVEEIVNAAWTNTSAARIIPPGEFPHDTFLGIMAFENGFSPDLLNALTAITNGSGTNVFLQYPVEVVETTNGAGRVRLYLPSASTNPAPVYTTTVSIANYPEAWIEDVYGDVPVWLSGDERESWFSDRDPWRKHILFDLIATSSVPAYTAMLTNAVNGIDAGTNTVSLSSLYSNDIAFVAMNTGPTGVDLYIQAPTNVPGIDIFRSTNLLDTYGWTLPATVEHVIDPVLWHSGYSDALNFFAAGNTAADTDQDGLSDARERRLYGTNPYLADSDGDGLSDGLEVLTYGLNPLNADSDGDGIPDNVEIAGNTNPNSSDSDGDGLTDYTEIYTYFGHVDPLDADTDNDGLSDYEEMVTYLSYPRTSDSDMDGLSDYAEAHVHGTNPRNPDTDGDGIDDSYEVSTGWDPNDPATATANDDGDAFNNLVEYQWNYNPTTSNSTPPTIQRLVLCPPGNGLLDSDDIRFLSVADLGAESSRIRVRPFSQGGTLAAQLLHHTQSPGFQINGVDASTVATPILVPASTSAVEYRITSDASARGTNLYFRLTSTNDPTSTKDSAYCHYPEISKVNFWVPGIDNNVDVYYGQTNTLWVGMPADTNACRVRMQPFQEPDAGFGTPTFSHTDYVLVKVTGTGADPTTNTLNTYDWQSAYGVWFNDIRNQGIRLDYGSYIFEVGFDMNFNGSLEPAEVQQTCNVQVPRVNINGDYNRDGNPLDHPDETNAVTFGGPKGFTILMNANDSDGDGKADCEESGDPLGYYINGTNDLDDIYILQFPRLGISTNDMPDDLKVTISVLKPGTETITDTAVVYPVRQTGQQGYPSFTLSAASTRLLFGGTGTVDMGIEGRAFGEQVLVRMQLKKGTKLLGQDEIRVLVSPWLALSNEEPITEMYSGFGDEPSFTSGMNSLFGTGNITWVNGQVWRQDEGEFGYTRTAVGQCAYRAQPVILDMSTSSDDYKDLISSTNGWEDEVRSLFHHRGGGVEVSVPDAKYPYGRLIISSHYSSNCDFFGTQQLQWPPIFLFVDWLLVAHVDEVMSVIPSGGSSVVCVGDLTNAIAILNDYTTYPTNEVEACSVTNMPYTSRSNLVSTYNDPNNATAIATIQGYLDSAATNLAVELGVAIIRIPVAYTLELDYTGVTGSCNTYLPNSVNAAVANVGGTVKVGVPDPAFSPFRDVIATRLSFLGANADWVNCDVPHLFKGEAHCTSNTLKEPSSSP